MSEPRELLVALAAAQAEFPPILMDGSAKIERRDGGAAFSYRYATLDEIVSKTRPVLNKHKLYLCWATHSDAEATTIRVTCALLHTSGEELRTAIEWSMPNDIKQLGGIITYLRRYTCTALLGITAEEDNDAHGTEGIGAPSRSVRPKPAAPPPPRSSAAAECSHCRTMQATAADELCDDCREDAATERALHIALDHYDD